MKKTYMGSGVYDGLPVVYVDAWSEVTPDRLASEWSKYVNAPSGTYRFEKLFADYWIDLIRGDRPKEGAEKPSLIASLLGFSS